jgi:hypothetical protein
MTVHVVKYEPDSDVVPQAIIWRPLRYFTLVVRDGQDDFDKYRGASFTIGNDIHFDLRVYEGHIHAEVTVTLYLPESIHEDHGVAGIVSRIIGEMAVPNSAVAWKRGQEFQFGKLERSPQDRLGEREARILILKIAASQPGHSATVAKIHQEIPKYFELSADDKTRSPSRKNEFLWQIIVRNTMSSHRAVDSSIFAQGWAEKTPNGLRVTHRGLGYLNSIGFCEFSNSDLPDDK